MGSWIGGDSDGNPNVTAETRSSPRKSRPCDTILRHYLVELQELGRELSISSVLVDATPELKALAERPDRSRHREDEALPPRLI